MEPAKRVNPFENTHQIGAVDIDKIEVVLGRKRKKEAKVTGLPHALDELPSEHEITKKYRPKFLGKGGENLVYEAEGRKDVVIKAQKQSLAKALAFNAASGLEPGDESITVDELREGKLKQERERYKKLRDVFGNHVLPQKYFVMQVPVGEKVLKELEKVAEMSEVNLPKEANAGWTIVSIQKQAGALKDERRLSMGGANLERYMVNSKAIFNRSMRDIYRHVTEGLMDRERAETSEVDAEDMKFLMAESAFRPLVDKAERDPELAAVLADFQKKAVEFSEKNDDILDVAGRDNIVFHRDQDGAWTYTIIDGLYPFDTDILSKGREAAIKNDMGFPLDHMEVNAIGQSVNYVRVINGLGKILNTGAYIDLTPEELKRKRYSYSDLLINKDEQMFKE